MCVVLSVEIEFPFLELVVAADVDAGVETGEGSLEDWD